MQRGPRERLERPLPGEGEEAEEQVDDLQDREGLHGGVEVLGQEVPEDLGPEEAFERGGALVGGGGQDDEARPVVLDELAHFWGGGVVVAARERARSTRRFCRWCQVTLLLSSDVSICHRQVMEGGMLVSEDEVQRSLVTVLRSLDRI